MQNSAVMAIRATVLLVCLIAVPVIAICGKSAPEVVKSLIRDYTDTPAKVASTSARSTDAPVFRPGLMGSPAGPPVQESAASATFSDRDSLSTARSSSNGSGPPRPLHSAPSGPITASQAGLSPNSHADVRTAGADIPSPSPVIATIAHQVDSPTAAGKGPDRQAMPGSRPSESSSERFGPDYFRSAETRLRALGASYYLLETLGPAGDQYRFVCKVATGSQPEQLLAFFATDRDPLAAMNNVVRQVEGWRSHRNQ
jgi:hypothetical protein